MGVGLSKPAKHSSPTTGTDCSMKLKVNPASTASSCRCCASVQDGWSDAFATLPR